MTTSDTRPTRSPMVVSLVLLLLWATLAVVSIGFARRPALSGLLFVLLGASALSLAGFSPTEVGCALRAARAPSASPRSALFWEAVARNAWLSGTLGSVLFFVLALCDSDSGLHEVATGMALAFVPAIYGLGLGLLSLVPVIKLRHPLTRVAVTNETESPEQASGESGPTRANVLGYALFAALLLATIVWRYGPLTNPRFPLWGWLVSWPALVFVALAVLAVTLIGAPLRVRVWTAAFAFAGLLGALVGLVQVLTSFAARNLAGLTSGLSFVLSSCFVALLALAAVAGPAVDRTLRSNPAEQPSWLERTIWALFPAAALLFLVLTFILVITPMTARAG
jgi:hypothetical protein